jgi:predicted hotdog family 3-hydroxylacyl-ACP dehydratase
MIILSETTDNLQVVLGGSVTTNQLECYTSWRDRTSTTFVAGRTVINTNNTTDVTIAAAPASSTQRVIDYISVYNDDTVNATVTIKLDANGTEYILFKTTLAATEKIEYHEGQGFKVIASTGAIKQSINQGANASSSGLTAVVLGSDVTNNNAVANTIADVTGLSFSVTANKSYYFKFVIRYTAAAATTGSRWGVNCTAGTAANLTFISEYTLTATTSTRNAMVQAFDSPATSSASSIAAMNICIMEGHFTPTADGTFIARFASEVSSSAIVAKAGSVVYYQQLN